VSSYTCPKGCKPFDGKAPPSESLTFVVGKSSRPPFDKIGTHGSSLEACGCGSPTHRDDLIECNAAWWGKLNRAQRLAALAHEHGHAALGLDCEECCDRHGGMLMRSWGYTEPGIKAAYDSMIESYGRQGAGDRAVEGARAHRAQAGYDSAYQLSSPSGGLPDQAARGLAFTRAPSSAATPTLAKGVLATPAPAFKTPAALIPGKPIASAINPPASAPVLTSASGIDPGGPNASGNVSSTTVKDPGFFNPATPGDANPNLLADLDATLSGVKIDKTIVVSEVVSGLLVAFLVFVIFRWGGKSA